ncbi:acyl-CoA dehydrogenase family protein [Adlercreutzia sp. R21]|uniref:Acyl-CoA dehydrogenase family protein n=1 Tax=Adlercreutzia wanghongyangiae TaxID=3111451 RepID=A0ABU6IHC0_9ACTN|nr:acyl-CoA dehydrogenase family protein [Adlercreutzia sp. R21]MEC4175824.1 acyl-CoA dehydrogenase family protein [Adlercreutzia sp. R7]MEC4183227.1 acyl-CoA dehydrogenase family protein [Adlercreutzia sp. R21]
MAIAYTDEQKELIALVRDVAQNEILPHVAAADEAGECPPELFQWGFDLGLHMVEIPEEYGGMGLSYETCAMMFEELAKVDAAYADTFVTNFVAFRNIMLNGTPEQARHFVEKTENGGFAAFCLSESCAGSDVAAMRTTAVREGDEYVLNGTKTFITNGSISDIYVVFAKTDPAAGAHGITGFLIDGDTPGLSAGAKEHKMGFRLSDTSEVVLDNVRVPASAVIGEEGRGMSVALNALNLSRAFISTLAVGIMQRAVDEAVAYAKQRKQFGTRLIDMPMVQTMLADMAIKTECARVVVNNCMRQMDAGEMVRKDGAIVKTFVTDAMQEVVSNAVQVFGGYGYSKEYPVEKLMRDAKIFQIFEGSNQIQRMTIARELDREYK